MQTRVLGIGGLAFTLICVLGAAVYVPRIEDDLQARSEEALGAAGVPFQEVALSGRDATVTVLSTRDPSRAGPVVADVSGVRTASVDVVEPAWKEPPPAKRNPWVRTTVSADYAELVGLLPSEAAVEKVRAAVSQSLGGLVVREAVALAPADAPAPWLDAYIAALHVAGEGTTELSIELKGDRARLVGSVPDETTRDAVVAAVKGELRDVDLDAALIVRRPAATPEEEKP